MKSFGKAIVIFTVALAMTLSAGSAFAKKGYPSRPVKVIVPYGPGGDSDLATRVWADAMERELGVPFVVVNKSGGSGVVGTAFAARAKADGYTLSNAGIGNTLISPNFSNAPYSLASFKPVVKNIANPFCFVVPADSPYKTFQDFIDACKANPGRVTLGSYGAASSGTIMASMIANQLGFKPKFVQASGGALSMVSLIGGHIDACVSFPPIADPHVKSGKARIIALGQRMDAYPGVPSFADFGVEGVFEGYGGIFAPAGVPQDVVDILVEASKKAIKDPKVVKAFHNMNALIDFRHGESWEKELEGAYNGFSEAAKAFKK